jgi:rubrerythrin
MRNAYEVYRRFIDFEEQAAAIYLRMASRFSPENPELATVWLNMGIQEKAHAGLLQFCLAEELFAGTLPQDKEIRDIEALFSRLAKDASNPDLTVDASFQIALQLEKSEVNALYDKLTKPMHTSAYLLRRKIATSLPDHLEHLIQEARRFGVPEEALKELKVSGGSDEAEG